MPLKVKVSIVLTSMLIAVFAVLLFLVVQAKNKEQFNGFYNEVELPDFTLTDHNGDTKSLSDFHGNLVLLNFGYTSCPDICPTTLTKLKSVYKKLGQNQNEVQVLFVSVDPERDSLSKLKKYVPYFHDDFIGLTGNEEQLNKLSEAFNIVYFKEGINKDNDYLMSHPTSIYLIDKQGKLILKYPHSSKPEFLVSDIENLL